MIRLDNVIPAVPFFTGRHDTLIRSCLEGYQGSIWTPYSSELRTAVMISQDFTFFGGVPDLCVLKDFPWEYTNGYTIFTPHTSEWESLILDTYPGIKAWERYSILHEPDRLNPALLRHYIDILPEGFSLCRIDRSLYHEVLKEDWSRDFCCHFPDFESFDCLGGGYCVLHDGRPVSGASSYARYHNGIELEVDTVPEFRRLGLARAAASAMMLDCLSRGLYPSWDASGLISVALAESLGYRRGNMYRCYFVRYS